MPVDMSPYVSVKRFLGPLDQWLGEDDAARLQAYSVYESFYRNLPEAFKLVQRGNEQNPIYLPSARTIVEATNRFLAKGWTYALDPAMGSDGERQVLDAALTRLFRREQLYSKFGTQKRWGLIRGDQVWHITADQNKPEGSRISVYEVDPGAYFPIHDPWNLDKVLGVHLVVPVLGDDGKTVIKRQTYRKTEAGRISYELSWWESGAWDDRDGGELKPAETIPEGDLNKPTLYELDPRITSIPVYHIKNDRSGQPFGTSELAGLETIIAGINQAITDEDLALVLEGLGLYWTNSGPPLDDDGEETNWKLGPGWVVEIDKESTFGRVQGVQTIDPWLAHMDKLASAMREGSGVADIAVGKVDSALAESGIALAFHMGPLLAKNAEKEQEILSVTDHMFYDLTTMWFPTYEGITGAAEAVSICDDPMPTDRKATLDEIIAMLTSTPPLISAEYARALLSEKLGYDFPDDMFNTIVTQAAALAQATNVDPFASRVAGEIDNAEGGGAGAA
jgi:hypothetical protein